MKSGLLWSPRVRKSVAWDKPQTGDLLLAPRLATWGLRRIQLVPGTQDSSCHIGKTHAEGWERPLLLSPGHPSGARARGPPKWLAPSLSSRATRRKMPGSHMALPHAIPSPHFPFLCYPSPRCPLLPGVHTTPLFTPPGLTPTALATVACTLHLHPPSLSPSQSVPVSPALDPPASMACFCLSTPASTPGHQDCMYCSQ